MIVYFSMLFFTCAFALCSMYYPERKLITIEKTGKQLCLKPKNIFAFLSFLPLFLVGALRYMVGVDYHSYTYIFESVNAGGSTHTEIGYRMLNLIVGAFTDDPQWIYAVTSLITLSLIVYGCYKYSKNPAMSLFLFITAGYVFSSFNILRQYIAIALVFASLKLIKEGRFFPFLLVILLAATFHKTAVIMIPLYFLLRLRLKQSYMLMITAAGMCLIPLRGVLTSLLVNTFYPQYAGTDLIKSLSAFEFLYYVLLFAAVLFLCFRYKTTFFNDGYNLVIFNASFYSFLVYLCLSFVPEVNRIAVYIEFFVILLIPRLIEEEKNKKVRGMYYALFVLFYLFFFVLSIGVMGRYNVLPYQTVFSR